MNPSSAELNQLLNGIYECRDGVCTLRDQHYSYKLHPGAKYAASGYGLDVPFSSKPDIDEKKMSVKFPFADGMNRDGVGDLLDVEGIDLSRHRANPIVLYDHAKTYSLPVALAAEWDEDSGQYDLSKYTVDIDPIARVATVNAFFYRGKGMNGVDRAKEYEHAVFCEQLFDMMAKGLIRAGSIGYQVVEARELPPDYRTGTPKGLHLQRVLMLEASAVVLPANGDTVRKMLAMPSSCGKPLSPYLIKSLKPYAEERKAMMVTGEKGLISMQEVMEATRGKSQPSDKISPEKACILPGQEIQGRIQVASKAIYSGKVINIRTASGKTLAVTTNHPVLTITGFSSAGNLCKGDHLLGYVGKNKTPLTDGYEQHAPSLAEQIFESLLAAGGTQELSGTSALDFHGDAAFFKSAVQIIRADCPLRFDSVADTTQCFDQSSFAGKSKSKFSLAGSRDTHQIGGVPFTPLASFMGVSNKSIPFGLGQFTPTDTLSTRTVSEYSNSSQFPMNHGFADVELVGNLIGGDTGFVTGNNLFEQNRVYDDPVPRVGSSGNFRFCSQNNPITQKSFADRLGGHTKDFGDSGDIIPGKIATDDFFGDVGIGIGINPSDFLRVGPASSIDACLFKLGTNGLSADAVLSRKLLNEFSTEIITDEIIDIEVFHYEGPVYDFQSPLGYILAEGLVTSNCQILKDGEANGEPLTEAQRGMFGAACGKKSTPADLDEIKGLRTRYRRKSTPMVGEEKALAPRKTVDIPWTRDEHWSTSIDGAKQEAAGRGLKIVDSGWMGMSWRITVEGPKEKLAEFTNWAQRQTVSRKSLETKSTPVPLNEDLSETDIPPAKWIPGEGAIKELRAKYRRKHLTKSWSWWKRAVLLALDTLFAGSSGAIHDEFDEDDIEQSAEAEKLYESGKSPQEAARQLKNKIKAMSAMTETSGGALREPPAMGEARKKTADEDHKNVVAGELKPGDFIKEAKKTVDRIEWWRPPGSLTREQEAFLKKYNGWTRVHFTDGSFKEYGTRQKIPIVRWMGSGPRPAYLGGKSIQVKSLTDIRRKYRPVKGLRRRLRKSSPGAASIRIAAKDMDEARKLAESKGCKFERVGDERVKLMGPDESIDEVAKSFGRRYKALALQTKGAELQRALSRIEDWDQSKRAQEQGSSVVLIYEDGIWAIYDKTGRGSPKWEMHSKPDIMGLIDALDYNVIKTEER